MDQDDRAHSVVEERKFVRYESNLKQLVSCIPCQQCGGFADDIIIFSIATSARVKVTCVNGHLFEAWDIQPMLGNMYAFNLLQCVATMISGQTYTDLQKMSSFTGLVCVNQNTYYSVQRNVTIPIINEHDEKVIEKARDEMRGVCTAIASDARFDSPGQTAKYGTNTCQVVDTGKIVAASTLQISPGKGSAYLEHQGLKNCLNNLDYSSFPVLTVATDRNQSVARFLRDERPEIEHKFDMWHFVRNVKTKVRVKCKPRACRELEPWIKSIGNHLWWCATNCSGDANVMREMWMSILFHVTNLHTFPEFETYKACQHSPHTQERQRKTRWLRKNSPAYDALECVVMDHRLLKAMDHLANPCHTGYLEVFHSVINSYCSKRLEFDLPVMEARVKLAVIDFNCNVGRKQDVVKRQRLGSKAHGEPKWKYQFSRYSKEWVPKPVKEPKSYGCAHLLMRAAVDLKITMVNIYACRGSKTQANIATKNRPSEEDMLTNYRHFAKFQERGTGDIDEAEPRP